MKQKMMCCSACKDLGTPKKRKKGLRHPQRRASSSSKLFDWPNAIGATFSMKGKGGGGGGFGLTKS